MKITNRSGTWYSAELTSVDPVGYGTYTTTIISDISVLDRNVVVSPFYYNNATQDEIDAFEISRWGSSTQVLNTEYNIYMNGGTGGSYNSGRLPLSSNINLTNKMIWDSSQIYFEMKDINGNNIATRTYTGSLKPSIGGSFELVAWLFNGLPPSNGLSQELVLSSYSYVPYSSPTPTPTPTPASSLTATINASPASGTLTVGSPTTVNVTVNGGGTAFNAAQATVAVSPNLSVTGLSITPPGSGGCNFTYTQTPTISNPSFAGAILASSSPSCTVYTLTVNPTSSGTGTITITNGSVKAYSDNSEIFSSVTNGSYTIVAPTPTPTATPVPPTATPTPILAVPAVTSPAQTYLANITLSGTKASTITTVFVNSSSSGITYPTGTAWQIPQVLVLGGNTFSIYGKDSLGNQSATTVSTITRHKLSDINGDGLIDLTDISLFGSDWQKTSSNWANPLSDMNSDSIVDLTDFSIIAKQYGQ